MEQHNSLNRHRALPGFRPGGLGRRIGAGAAGLLLLAAVSGCGGHEADTGALIVVDQDDADWTLPDNYGGGTLSPAQPILIKVQTTDSAGATTNVPGANITVLVGGIGVAPSIILDPISGLQIDNGAGVLQTVTDDHGVVVVVPQGTLAACPGGLTADLTITGNLSLGIFIAGDSSSWNGNFTYTCKA